MKVSNYMNHLKTVLTHKKYVLHYCRLAGITWKGIKHDMSKFSPTEFIESAKYYQGNRSPIDACKEVNGYSMAWFHHKGRNKHHYEYWVDNFDNGGTPVQMPYQYALELICDYLGAGHAYMKENFTYEAEYQWWVNKNKNPLMIHPHTSAFVTAILIDLAAGKNPKYVLRTSKYTYHSLEERLFLQEEYNYLIHKD